MIDSRIKKIVLTGGPCAGKSTILAGIQDYLVEKGYYVITLDETATQLIRSNMPPLMDRERVLIFQDIVLKTQLGKEISAIRYADELLKDEKVIILCDRAIMDNKAYLPTEEDFQFILEQNGLKYRLIVKSTYSDSFALSRNLKRTIMDEFNKNNITVPYNQVVIHNEL